MIRRGIRLLSLLGLLAASQASVASAETFAPVDRPGPGLSVDTAAVEKAIVCSPGIDAATRPAVLLLQGTGATAKDNWSWTYAPAFDKLGIPWCALDLPEHATADVQQSGEYVVHALRTVAARTRQKVSIVGHSQGGMVGRWALRWWPDTRALVDDLIGFAPSNHGTTEAVCSAADPCSPAGWQQRDEADFIRALNSRQETFAGISYTSVYTRTDETVKPNQDTKTGSSSLRTGDGMRTNVATQDICPTAVYEHLLIGTIDPVAYALAIDALAHPGPADPARVSRLVCAQPFHPGINPVTGPADGAAAAASFQSYQARTVTAEPALACYTTASCGPAGSGAGAPGVTPARLVKPSCQSRRRFAVNFRALRPGVRATLAGKRFPLRRLKNKRLRGTVDLRTRRRQTVLLVVRGTTQGGRKIKLVRRYRTCR